MVGLMCYNAVKSSVLLQAILQMNVIFQYSFANHLEQIRMS